MEKIKAKNYPFALGYLQGRLMAMINGEIYSLIKDHEKAEKIKELLRSAIAESEKKLEENPEWTKIQ